MPLVSNFLCKVWFVSCINKIFEHILYCDVVQIFIVIQIYTVIMSKLSIYLFTITQNIQETN